MQDDVKFDEKAATDPLAIPSSLDPAWRYWRPYGLGKTEGEAIKSHDETQDSTPSFGPQRNTTQDFDAESATKPTEYYEDGVLEDDETRDADPFAGLIRTNQPWEVVKEGAPGWALKNWNLEIKRYEVQGASYHAIRALKHAKIRDANAFVSRIRGSTYQDHKLQQKVRLAWVAFHPKWVKAEAERIVAAFLDNKKQNLASPYSQRAIISGLSRAQQREWNAYRKLITRRSRAKGIRNRSRPGQVRQVLVRWQDHSPADAYILEWLADPMREGAAYFAYQQGINIDNIPYRVSAALLSWQDFKERQVTRAPDTIGPNGLPQSYLGGEVDDDQTNRTAIGPNDLPRSYIGVENDGNQTDADQEKQRRRAGVLVTT